MDEREVVKFKNTWYDHVLQKILNWGKWEKREVVWNWQNADVITSKTRQGTHRPILDIDFHAELIPSTTPGHFHLYLDKEMSWEQYSNLLKAMRDCGIIDDKYYGYCMVREDSSVRLPWVKKEPGQGNSGSSN